MGSGQLLTKCSRAKNKPDDNKRGLRMTNAVKTHSAAPRTPPEKYTGIGEEMALTEAVDNTAIPQHGIIVFLPRGTVSP